MYPLAFAVITSSRYMSEHIRDMPTLKRSSKFNELNVNVRLEYARLIKSREYLHIPLEVQKYFIVFITFSVIVSNTFLFMKQIELMATFL